jgi:hypothetical protein
VKRGGYCTVEDCVVENALGAGIQVVDEVPANSVGGGQIKGNRVINPNAANMDVANDGYTTYHPSGINANGYLLLVAENMCLDTRAAPFMRYGIEVGGNARPMADRVTVVNNVCSGSFYSPAQINFSAATNSAALGNFVGNPGSTGGIATRDPRAGNVYWNNAGHNDECCRNVLG